VEVPLQQVAEEVLLMVAGQIAQRGVQVKVTQEPIWLTGDKVRLVEVFQNLIDNAAKFFGDQPNPRLEIGAEVAGGQIVLFVRDNGKGIAPHHQAKVFEIFEKLDPRASGSGIGLALVRRIIELHGGRIWVESEVLGHGTTFRFTLANTKLR
jgi:signal transduction histidine kinase